MQNLGTFVGGASVLLSLLIGVSLGLLSGYVGGRIDALIMRVCDVMLSFPSILIALLFAGVGHAIYPNAGDSLAFSVVIIAFLFNTHFFLTLCLAVSGKTAGKQLLSCILKGVVL